MNNKGDTMNTEILKVAPDGKSLKGKFTKRDERWQ